MNDRDLKQVRRRAEKLGLADRSRTLLLCVDRREAGCASAKQMSVSWKYLKRRSKELGLSGRSGLLRLKMGCCGLCQGGPIAAVMPDGIWYGRCTPKVLDQILQQHIRDGQVVDEFVIARPIESPVTGLE